jgi:HAD superfamily hydrolase (TIGR01549 family)
MVSTTSILSRAPAVEPKCVIFDTDNTLYPYDIAHGAAISAVTQKVQSQLMIDKQRFEEILYRARQDIKNQLGETAASHSRLLYFQRALELMGLGTQILLSLDLEATYWRSFLREAVLFEGVKEFITQLRARGVTLCIITDLTAQIQFRKMVHFELDSLFDFVVTSEEAGYDKPHAAPFILLKDKARLSRFLKDEVWMIGDNADSDILGARQHLGAFTLQKIHTGVHVGDVGSAPDMAFENYRDLCDLYLSISQRMKKYDI